MGKPTTPVLARILLGLRNSLNLGNMLPDNRQNKVMIFQDADRFILPGNPDAVAIDPTSNSFAIVPNRVSDGHALVPNPGATSGGGSLPYTNEWLIAGYPRENGNMQIMTHDPAAEFAPFNYTPNLGGFVGQCIGCDTSNSQGPFANVTNSPLGGAGGDYSQTIDPNQNDIMTGGGSGYGSATSGSTSANTPGASGQNSTGATGTGLSTVGGAGIPTSGLGAPFTPIWQNNPSSLPFATPLNPGQ